MTAGPNHALTSLMELQRFGVGADFGMPMFQWLRHHFMNHLRNQNYPKIGVD
jgi:hypothetical protein